METLIDIMGWLAAALILAGYALVSSGRLDPRSVAYQVLNAVGAVGFIINSGWNGAMPSAALNVVWLAIAIYGLLRFRGKGGRPGAT